MKRMARSIFIFLFIAIVATGCQRSAPLSEDEKRLAENALKQMHVKEGLEVQLFASEPMVTNPTNITVDEKGRVWVCEAYNYDVSPDEADAKGDRIIVLEDTDHDGRADKRTVFYQGTDITTPLGIMVVGDKVYVSRSPNVFVFTDTNGDQVADNKEVLFTNLGRKGDHSAHSMMPGPDGLLYFSTGNMAGDIQDNNGNPLIDKSLLGGKVMRFDEEGKHFEVLGHNFRNNYEPCIDSYGNIWQSDNDDDGNESCRINFVMPYGNYGYLDEFTKASWSTNRVGIEDSIPDRHWHQHDPGVVPNVLITGAGSPAGMTFYEGDELGAEFNGVPIHAEPYYNVVRAYFTKRSGAGYTASIGNILQSEDQWFRPVDVATAPDGSLMIADWYDPILGGGAAGDASHGRIYRVAKDISSYNSPSIDLATIKGALEALKNANPGVRFSAFGFLRTQGESAVGELKKLWKSDNSVFRARAFWLLVKTNEQDAILDEALKDADVSIRTAAIKAVVENKSDVVPWLQRVSKDSDAGVRREAATALRYSNTESAANLWVTLANQYDGRDRWYLEALGIGADLHADLFFTAWQRSLKFDSNNPVHRDIVWRMRATATLPLLAELIKASNNIEDVHRYFRAFDFHREKQKTDVLISLLNGNHQAQPEIDALALQQMDAQQVVITPPVRKALNAALVQTAGTMAFIDLVDKFSLVDQSPALLRQALADADSPVGAASTELLVKFNRMDLLEQALRSNDSTASALLTTLKGKGASPIVELVAGVASDSTRSIGLRQNAIRTLGSSWPGEEKLLALVKEPSFSKQLKPSAAAVLFNVYRSSIQREAANYLTKPGTQGSKLPSIKQLMASSGSVENGKIIFEKYCTTCHRVANNGAKFGPELTQVGSKLSKDGIFQAIIFPDDGISYGFESHLITQRDGQQVLGIIANNTEELIELAQPGGTSVKIMKSDITKDITTNQSIMPALAETMKQQELIDLVTYLSNLKK